MIKRCLIGFTVLISCFLFASKVSAQEITLTGYTYDTDVVYATLKNNGIDVSNYKYIIMNGYFTSTDQILIYLFNDNFTWLDVDARTGGTSKVYRGAPYGINYTVALYKANNTIVKSGTYTSNGYNGSGVSSWYGNSGYFMLRTNFPVYSNYDTGITGVSGTVYNNYLTLPVNNELVIDEINKTITIPIYYFYQNEEWQNYYLYFASPTINNMNYSLKFEYISKDKNLPELPIELIIHDKIDDVHQHLANISNSKYTSGNGFGGGFSVTAGNFGGGGGGGRFDDNTDINSCMATTPFTYSGSFANERIYGLAALSLNSCYDLTGKTPNDFNTEAIKITYNARLIDLNTEGELGNDPIGDMLEDIRNEHQLEQENISFDIFAPVIKLVTDKLPIINQFNQILNQFNYNENFDTPPTFFVDIPYFNLKNIEVFNFHFFDEYRDYAINLQCLIMAIYTSIKCYRIVNGYFGGGDSE